MRSEEFQVVRVYFIATFLLLLLTMLFCIKTYDSVSDYGSIQNSVMVNEFHNDKGLKGLSFGDWGYVVVTQGMDDMRVAAIDDHEFCHQLVERDYNHFCVEYRE